MNEALAKGSFDRVRAVHFPCLIDDHRSAEWGVDHRRTCRRKTMCRWASKPHGFQLLWAGSELSSLDGERKCGAALVVQHEVCRVQATL